MGWLPLDALRSRSLWVLFTGSVRRRVCLSQPGSFSSDATAYVEHIDPKVILVDGRRLAELMIDFEVGVTTARTYHVKRVDSDYFEEA